MASFQTPREIVASTISSLQSLDASSPPVSSSHLQSSNPLREAPQHMQKVLLTLHVLFPNELLPALDVLDRNLVTRLKVYHDSKQQVFASSGDLPGSSPARYTKVYMLRSGQIPHRLRQFNHTTSYEVRLNAWSCSCPAFAFSACPATTSDPPLIEDITQQRDIRTTHWKFGGLTLGTDMPVCKHLLACVLVEHSGLFEGFVEERQVSIEELAGWAAGWGD